MRHTLHKKYLGKKTKEIKLSEFYLLQIITVTININIKQRKHWGNIAVRYKINQGVKASSNTTTRKLWFCIRENISMQTPSERE